MFRKKKSFEGERNGARYLAYLCELMATSILKNGSLLFMSTYGMSIIEEMSVHTSGTMITLR